MLASSPMSDSAGRTCTVTGGDKAVRSDVLRATEVSGLLCRSDRTRIVAVASGVCAASSAYFAAAAVWL